MPRERVTQWIFTQMKRVITAQDVPDSGEIRVPVGSIVTASAHHEVLINSIAPTAGAECVSDAHKESR